MYDKYQSTNSIVHIKYRTLRSLKLHIEGQLDRLSLRHYDDVCEHIYRTISFALKNLEKYYSTSSIFSLTSPLPNIEKNYFTNSTFNKINKNSLENLKNYFNSRTLLKDISDLNHILEVRRDILKNLITIESELAHGWSNIPVIGSMTLNDINCNLGIVLEMYDRDFEFRKDILLHVLRDAGFIPDSQNKNNFSLTIPCKTYTRNLSETNGIERHRRLQNEQHMYILSSLLYSPYIDCPKRDILLSPIYIYKTE